MPIEWNILKRERLLNLARRFTKKPLQMPSITPAPRNGSLPLSLAQQRLWFLAQMEGVNEAYHISFGVRLRGGLQVPVLRQALDRIVARHEALRTTFGLTEGEPVQRIVPVEASRFHLLEDDLRRHPDGRGELDRLIKEEARAAFNLEEGPLIRGRLIREGEEQHVLLITMHHIVSDGWSMGVFRKELSALYAAFALGQADPLPELKLQYADYAVWQRRWLEGEILQQQAEYWKKMLAGAPALLELPRDHARPAEQKFGGGWAVLELDENLTKSLAELGKRHGTTLHMTLLAGWAVLLARLSGEADLVIGTPMANRGRVEIEELIGFFVNAVPLRLDISGSPTVGKLLARVKKQTLAAQQHQDISFEQIVEITQPARSLAHSPVFQVMFAWQNAPQSAFLLPGHEITPVSMPHETSKFDLTLVLHQAGDRIVGGVEYATALFEPATIASYSGYLRSLLEEMVADDTEAVDQLPMLTETERQQVVYGWNETEVKYRDKRGIHELFEERVRIAPASVAVEHEGVLLSYAELNRRANQLAHYLREAGVRPGALVAICAERSLEMVMALLGVLKAGGAYVPLDPEYPPERLRYMLKHTAPVAVLAQAHVYDLFTSLSDGVRVIDMGAGAVQWKNQPDTNLDGTSVGLAAEHLAYVIYTSGSTGAPKGVMVPHEAIKRLVLDNGYAEFGPADRVAFASSPAFDAATMEIWAPLLNGGRIVVVDRSVLLEPVRFEEALNQQKINVLWLTVALFNQYADVFMDEFSSLRYLIVGGDVVDPRVVARVLRENPPCHLLNGYGPTETTTFASTHEIRVPPEDGQSVPIGRPITNTQIYILDPCGQPVPAKVTGELHIGGTGVARGYLKQPDLTAERFMPDPFTNRTGARMYKTGDLGRWRADGSIEFVGRNDSQVKIRGYRIELAEIEARLDQHMGVEKSVVIARPDRYGDKRIVAYIVPADDEGLRKAELSSFLARELPEYMVPSSFLVLEKLPLTSNRKIDRKALQSQDALPSEELLGDKRFISPRDNTEVFLAALWEDLLGITNPGVKDNFFDLGGHSLKALVLADRIGNAYRKKMPVAMVFANPTIEEMASALRNTFAECPPSSVIPIQSRGKLRPFFCVHSAAGVVDCWVPLARRLRPDQPVYGLQANGLAEGGPPLTRIEDMAALYIKDLKAIQPEGPYQVGGWCIGGNIAYEIAQQLRAAGDEVALLVLFDAVPYEKPDFQPLCNPIAEEELRANEKETLLYLLAQGGLQPEHIEPMTADQRLETLLAINREHNRVPPDIALKHTRRFIRVWATNAAARRRYRYRPFPGRITLFRSSTVAQDVETAQWQQLAQGGLDLYEFPADHLDFLDISNCGQLAETLTCLLERVPS